MKLSALTKKLLVFLYLLPLGLVFPQPNGKLMYADNPNSVIVFEYDNKISITTFDLITGTETVKQGIYTTSMKYGISFIKVTWENGTVDTFLMLSNSLVCFLYKAKDSNPYVLGFSGSYNRGEFVFRNPKSITASSSFIENGKPYSPDQINTRLGQAWVEGVNGQGIHEKLFINTQLGCTALHISTGFISYEKPYLYKENSRPKKLNVSVAKKFSFTIDILDTPNFQTINLPQALEANDILVIEILDVYPGTKYEDTCINCILYDTRSVN